MAARIGTISGVALVPGVSRNGRLYTAETIGRAVTRAQARIAEGSQPLTMLSHHEAGDDSRQIVGRIRSMAQLDDGSAAFTADLADTEDARTIAALVDTAGGEPFLRGVSIRGAWVGKVSRQPGPDGAPAETASDLEIFGLDFTHKPGVLGAHVDSFTPEAASAPAESVPDGRVLITESVQEALVTTTTEADTPKAETPVPGGGPYADPGYQSDKKKRYPIDTKARAKSAWSYVNQADNARLYTSAQLKRVKQRITKALKGFGVQVATQEGWLIEPTAQVTEALAECWGMDSADAGNLYVSLGNGATTVTVSSYSLDPHDLDAVGRAAMAGAVQAILNIDPDLDGDVDVPGEPDDDAATATAAGAPCPCGCGCAIPEMPGGCPCECESCMHCKGEQDEDDDAMESIPYVAAGAQPTARHWQLLQERGVLAPGVRVTAAMVNEAIDARSAALAAPTETPAAPAAETTTQETEPAMAESTTTPAAETPGSTDGIDTLGAKIDKLSDVLAGFVTAMTPAPAAAESAPAGTVAEATPATPAAPAAEVTETQDQRIARLIAEGVKAALPQAIQEHVETSGGPSRKGLVTAVSETTSTTGTPQGLPEGAPDKPLHEYTPEEWSKHIAPAVTGAVFQGRG